MARGASHHPEVGQSLPGTCDKQVSIHTHMYPYCNNNDDNMLIIISILIKVITQVVAVEIKYRGRDGGGQAADTRFRILRTCGCPEAG